MKIIKIFFILVKEAPPVKKSLIQTIEREINGKNI